MSNRQSISPLKVLKVGYVVLFLLFMIVDTIAIQEEKKGYRDDINIQYERMFQYRVKPFTGGKYDNLGGSYTALFEYGNLTEELKNLLIDDIKNDGFRGPCRKKNYDGMIFCNDKIDISVIEYKNSEQVQVLIMQNEDDKRKN